MIQWARSRYRVEAGVARDRMIQGTRRRKCCAEDSEREAWIGLQRGMGSLKRLENENEVDDKKKRIEASRR